MREWGTVRLRGEQGPRTLRGPQIPDLCVYFSLPFPPCARSLLLSSILTPSVCVCLSLSVSFLASFQVFLSVTAISR